MDKKLQALVNETPPSCSIPLFHHLLQYLLGFVIGCGVVVAGITVIVKKPFKRNRKSIISKENKIKYIDMLT